MWHVQYLTEEGIGAVARFPTPELAIKQACRLLDDGFDVYGIGTGPLSDSIDRSQIARIYSMWKRTRPQHADNPANELATA
jgi:hypothetical protein